MFYTRYSGRLPVDISSNDGTMLMDFPGDPAYPIELLATQEQLAETLGVTKDKIVNVEMSKKLEYIVIEVDPSVDIPSLKVDSQNLVDLFQYSD